MTFRPLWKWSTAETWNHYYVYLCIKICTEILLCMIVLKMDLNAPRASLTSQPQSAPQCRSLSVNANTESDWRCGADCGYWKRSALRSRLGLAHETLPGQCYHKSTVPQGSRCSMRFIISATLSNNLTTECNCLQLLWGTWTLVIPAVGSYIPCDLMDSFQILKPSQDVNQGLRRWDPALAGICETTTVTSL